MLFDAICNIIVIGLIAMFLFCFIGKIVMKVISVKEFFKNVRNHYEIQERIRNTERQKDTPQELRFVGSQDSAINAFIQDRDLGTYFTWKDWEKGLVCVYTPNHKGAYYYVKFSCNDMNKAEIAIFSAVDRSFHYDAKKEGEISNATGLKNYYNSKILNDNEYLKEIQNELSNNGGEALFDATRVNGGEFLDEESMNYVAEALTNYYFEVQDIDYENNQILVTLADEVDESDVAVTEKEVDKAAYYTRKVLNDNAYIGELQKKLLEGYSEVKYDAKRLNNDEVLPPDELKCVIQALQDHDYEVNKADYEQSIVYCSLKI